MRAALDRARSGHTLGHTRPVLNRPDASRRGPRQRPDLRGAFERAGTVQDETDPSLKVETRVRTPLGLPTQTIHIGCCALGLPRCVPRGDLSRVGVEKGCPCSGRFRQARRHRDAYRGALAALPRASDAARPRSARESTDSPDVRRQCAGPDEVRVGQILFRLDNASSWKWGSQKVLDLGHEHVGRIRKLANDAGGGSDRRGRRQDGVNRPPYATVNPNRSSLPAFPSMPGLSSVHSWLSSDVRPTRPRRR